MQYYHNSKAIQLSATAVACGKFDGLHKGHQALLRQLESYKKQGLKSAIFTFDASIARILPEHSGFICTGPERRFFLERMGMDVLAEYAFDETLAGMDPEQFVREILVEQMGAQAIVVGEDFRFGYRRQGDISLLERFQNHYHYQLKVVEKQADAQGKISSSRIREQLLAGRIEAAQEMLGHPYFILGEVIHGRQLGRTIGMPTANLAVPGDKLLPPNGVYVSRNYIGDREEMHYGITNIGRKPTVNGESLGVETCLFDFERDIYGENMRVELLTFVRPEQKFADVEHLSRQMHRDACYGKEYVKKCRERNA